MGRVSCELFSSETFLTRRADACFDTCATTPSQTTSPVNPYGQYLDLAYDASYAGTGATTRHNLKTGGQIPSDILGEIDRKIDDGNPNEGSFRAMTTGVATTGCVTAAAPINWISQSPGTDCGGVSLF